MYDNPKLEKLKERLSGTRQRAAGTVTTYIDTAKRFLDWLQDEELTRGSIDKYFAWRRGNNISELTLKKEFFHLKKLFLANEIAWTFDKDDVPLSEDDPFQPALTESQVNQLIEAAPAYTKAECFYLSVSTTFGCRRIELSRINKRMVTDNTIQILTAKHGLKRTHLIPDPLRPLFESYHMKEHTETGLSSMFKRIVKKADMELISGYGWHSIRRCLDTLSDYFLAKNDLPPSLWADFVGWAKTTRGVRYTGAAMAGVYSHPEIMSDDPYRIDRLIYPVHPFLKTWERVLAAVPIESKEDGIESVEPENVTTPGEIVTGCHDPEAAELSPLDAILKRLRK